MNVPFESLMFLRILKGVTRKEGKDSNKTNILFSLELTEVEFHQFCVHYIFSSSWVYEVN